tara:strand:- start:1278 stop:2045 length:768 start_codon:yes stop_codon:yes gene_type:complete
MATINQSFTYKLPEELYVAGISTTKTGTYTYIGPDTFDVEVDGQGRIVKCDPAETPPGRKKTINANNASELPVAYLARNHQDEESFAWTEEFTDETLSNGDVYQRLDNPDLDDAYDMPHWNTATGTWDIPQLIKEQRNDAYNEAKRRKSYVETYKNQYDFGDTINTAIDNYLVGITSYITANPPYKSWKYTTQPTPPALPKMPVAIMAEFGKVPLPHRFAEGGGPKLNFPGEAAIGPDYNSQFYSGLEGSKAAAD